MSRKGLLLDRDGVINIDRGYVGKIEQFEFMPGVFPFLNAMQDKGFYLAILTNQSGVARGYYTEKDYTSLTEWMLSELSKKGISIRLILACFDHPEGSILEYRRSSYWRKPNPGMVIETLQRLNLDPDRSVFIGDNIRDLEAAQRGGISHNIWLTEPPGITSDDIKAAHSFDDVLKIIQTV